MSFVQPHDAIGVCPNGDVLWMRLLKYQIVKRQEQALTVDTIICGHLKLSLGLARSQLVLTEL